MQAFDHCLTKHNKHLCINKVNERYLTYRRMLLIYRTKCKRETYSKKVYLLAQDIATISLIANILFLGRKWKIQSTSKIASKKQSSRIIDTTIGP